MDVHLFTILMVVTLSWVPGRDTQKPAKFHISTPQVCPKMCKCSSHFERVSCIGKNLAQIPSDIPTNVTELYLSKNLLTKIKKNSFINYPRLKTLSLEENYITELEPLAFNGLKELKTLFMKHNLLTDISRDAFSGGLRHLNFLYLSQNRLKSVPDLSMLLNLTKVTLDYNNIQNNQLPLFPKSYLVMKNMTTLILAHNNIGKLDSQDFENLQNSKITKIELSWCKITNDIGNATFSKFTKLQSLSLSYNGLLSSSSVSGIITSLNNSNLNSLDLSNSTIFDAAFPEDMFKPLSKQTLRTLKMSHGGFKVLGKDTFKPIPKLFVLDLSYSLLEVIVPDTFKPLKYLQRLYLNKCNLKQITAFMLPSANFINLDNNPISSVLNNAFASSTNTSILRISNCHIQIMEEKAFTGLTNLQQLDLSHNNIAQLSLFDSLTALKTLNLGNNKVTRITSGKLFKNLLQLQTLDMSSNGLIVVPMDLFNPLINVKALNLEHNELQNVLDADKNGSLFKHLTRLQELQLSNNALLQYNNFSFNGLTNLTKLNLSNNQISSFNGLAFLSTPQLRLLDLANNKLSTFKPDSFEYIMKGSQLNLSGNFLDCWCDMRWFRSYLDQTDLVFHSNRSYKCGSPESMQGKNFSTFHPEDIESKCKPPLLKYFLYGGAITFVIALLLGIVGYLKRWTIVLYWYRMTKKFKVTVNHGQQARKTHFATVSFAIDDHSTRSWYQEKFEPKLQEFIRSKTNNLYDENDVFTDADILLGTGYSDQIDSIFKAMVNSKFIIIILNEPFMKDGRRKLELDLALQAAVEFSRIGLDQIIPITYNVRKMKSYLEIQNTLRTLLNKSGGDILEWKDPVLQGHDNRNYLIDETQRDLLQSEGSVNVDEAEGDQRGQLLGQAEHYDDIEDNRCQVFWVSLFEALEKF